MDGDGDLDLVCGNKDQKNALYENGGGVLSAAPVWSSDPANRTLSVAWGDMDGDGDLDIACGNDGTSNTVYDNDGGVLSTTPVWSSALTLSTQSVAWADMDGDGDLDLACGNRFQVNTVYENRAGMLSKNPIWFSSAENRTVSVAWGDVDGDGDLDLACGNVFESNTVYVNEEGVLSRTPAWSSGPTNSTLSAAWGDMDGDGNLDLAFGNFGQSNTVYLNDGSTLSTTPTWSSDPEYRTSSVAWGDVDGDGDLDLACGNDSESNTVYENQGNVLSTMPAWSSALVDFTTCVAWGDVDADGDLDLAFGKNGQGNTLYANAGSMLSTTPIWFSDLANQTLSVAWGDVDGDDDLDLACGNYGTSNTVYENEEGILSTMPVWSSDSVNNTESVAWGDVDGDGDLDLACGNSGTSNTVFENLGGMLSTMPVWSSGLANQTSGLAWGDLDGDGDFDLACGNFGQKNTVYVNDGGALATTPTWFSDPEYRTSSVAWGDVDGDGDLDLACGNGGTQSYRESNTLYLNEDGALSTMPVWTSGVTHASLLIAWGDVDGDGDLDLACGDGDQVSTVYTNEGGMLSTMPTWSALTKGTVAWGDADGDGDLDLASAYGPVNIYENAAGVLSLSPAWSSDWDPTHGSFGIAWGDMDGDGDLDLASGGVGFGGGVDAWNNTVYVGIRAPAFPHATQSPRHHLPNNAAHLRFVNASSVATNVLRVGFRAVDVESDMIFVTPQYQFEGDPRWFGVQLVGGDRRAGPFPSSPEGTIASFDWDFERFPADTRNVVLRLLITEIPHRVSFVQHVAPYLRQMGRITPRRAEVYLTATSLHFQMVTQGDSVSVDFDLQNVGTEPLHVTGLDLPSAEMTVFPEAPFTVDPGASVTVTIRLSPRTQLDADGEIVIASNDPIHSTLTIPVDTEILPLAFTTQLLRLEEIIPLGQAATVICQPAANVVLEEGALFYRAAGATEFAASNMAKSDAGFAGIIPGAEVGERGIEYYVQMENSGVFATDPAGAPAEFFTQAVARPRVLQVSAGPNLGSDYVEFDGIDVLALVEEGAEVTEGFLFFRPGGASEFESVVFAGTPPLLSATIPGNAVSSRGVEYWVEIETATTTLTDPPLDAPTVPRLIQVTVSNLIEPEEHVGQRYRMLSIPLEFEETFGGQVSDLLEFGDPDPTEWRVYRYLGENIELSPDLSGIFRPEPGWASWLITRSKHRVDTAPVAGLSTPTDGPYPVPLDPGWNQVGNPFNFPVSWESVERSDNISQPAAFDGSGQYADATLLLPFEGYFVHNAIAQPETLWVPPVEATTQQMTAERAIPDTHSDEITSADTWSLELRARSPHAEDMITTLGVHTHALDRYDDSDRRKPPSAPGAWIRLGMNHDDWEERSGMYRHDFRSPRVDGHRWDMVLRSQDVGEEVTLAGWADAEFPHALSLRLIDLEQGVTLDLRDDTGTYQLLSFGPGRDYKLAVLAGTVDYVEREAATVTEIPNAVVLDQNAPNPFNPSTRIRFGLPKAGKVTLVIYTTRGERVTTLLDHERLSAGFHTRIWSGQDYRGQRASSGVYLYQLVTEDRTISKKMVLTQ